MLKLSKLATLVAIVLCCTTTSFAQTSDQEPAAMGTFQFISKTKVQERFTADVLLKIEANRKQNKVYLMELSDLTTVRILPHSTINAPGFKPLTELYVKE